MNIVHRLFAALCLLAASSLATAAGMATCTGKFPNPLTDICWSCLLPITIGSATIANFGGQEDNGDNPGNPVCSCGVNPTIGLSIGFWEPARHVEATRKPFCLPSLGGLNLDPGIAAPEAARFTRPEGDGDGGSFYQAHFYTNPVLYWLEVVTDFPCLERGSFDLAYLTEVDPLWNDDELTLILNPDAVLFANPIAIAACAADCVAATVGFGLNTLFWCAGCQGGLYPMDGHVQYHMGGVRTAALLAQRQVLHPVDAHVHHHGPGLDPGALHQAGPPHGRHQEVGLPAHGGQVLRAAVGDGHGGVPLEEHRRLRLARSARPEQHERGVAPQEPVDAGQIAERGRYPAINVLKSISRTMPRAADPARRTPST